MGLTAGEIGNHAREVKLLREAADASNWTGPLFNLALAHKKRHETEKAIAAIDEAIKREREATSLVLLAQLKPKSAPSLVKEAFEIFAEPQQLDDWELHWYREAAILVSDEPRKTVADRELQRRKRGATLSSEGVPPDRRGGLVKR